VLTGGTTLVGLLGDPVSHSLSPLMQNAAFAARGLDWAYVPLRVEPERLEAAVTGLVALAFAGGNVTTPHKTAVLAFCDELDGGAERAGSVNTLLVRDGRVYGSTTDGLAVVQEVDAEGKHVLVLGAGGAAQAVATALAEAAAAHLVVAARDGERAHALAARLRSVFPDREIDAADHWPPDADGAEIIVNATPVIDEPLVAFRPEQAAVDLAYRGDGAATAFVEAAHAAGCAAVVDGLDILVGQGAASFERWTGIEAPADVMRRSLRSA
jgi:shikimate dehydrogenase